MIINNQNFYENIVWIFKLISFFKIIYYLIREIFPAYAII